MLRRKQGAVGEGPAGAPRMTCGDLQGDSWCQGYISALWIVTLLV